jgi:hypothetical protein
MAVELVTGSMHVRERETDQGEGRMGGRRRVLVGHLQEVDSASKQEVASGSSWELHAPDPSDSRRRQGNLQKASLALGFSLENAKQHHFVYLVIKTCFGKILKIFRGFLAN